MTTQHTIDKSKKLALDKLKLFLNPFVVARKTYEKQDEYYKGFEDGLRVAVNLMLTTSYQDLNTEPMNLIEKILE